MNSMKNLVTPPKAGGPCLQVSDVIATLRGIQHAAFTPAAIEALLSGMTVDDASLQPYVLFRPQAYTRNLIYRDDVFELLAVCWEPGSATSIHDHAGQDCWLYVHSGALCIDAFELLDAGHCHQVGEGIGVRRREHIDKMGEGIIDHRGPHNDIHRVFNRRSFNTRAVSLHVYARPIDECVVYEPAKRRATHKRMRYDTIAGCAHDAPTSI